MLIGQQGEQFALIGAVGFVAQNYDVATIAALKALAATHPAHVGGNVVTVLADGSRWSYHPTSSLTGDDLFVVTPTNASGRWLRKVGSVDLKLPIAFGTSDAAVLATLPAGARFLLRRGYWEITADFTGGNALMSSFKPGAVGVVAPEVTLNAWLGDVKIDLVGATFASRVTTVTKLAACLSAGWQGS